MKIYEQTFMLGEHEVTLQTGGIARQANSVMVKMKDTVVLVNCVAKKEARENMDFFPLTVNYQEKMYAAGRIPGGFFKREGRPGEQETLICRLIDRPIRPLFPKGFYNEVQIIATVMSLDEDVQPDILAMIGASAAVALSGVPFEGPIGSVRVGYANGEYCLNPSTKMLEDSSLDLVVAGTKDAVLMVESEAQELPEEIMLGAVLYGHEHMQVAIEAINDLVKVAGSPRWKWTPVKMDETLQEAIQKKVWNDLKSAYKIKEKLERQSQLDVIRDKLKTELLDEEKGYSESAILSTFSHMEKAYVRGMIIKGEPRIDGRNTRTVRPIAIQTGLLPRAHGSAVFTRGETQAIVVTTLGSERDAQNMDNIMGESKNRFMLHYNFPPYCVGETGMVGSPKRREIGHGNLARRGLKAVLPQQDAFPYVMRLVSEITESNGSSSMASICGGSLAMMDAGVPIKAPVAGIAMGLIKEDDKFAVLTDILGDEDHLGDMDFKVAGTADGVTALQMDIKINGITKNIMETALSQAKEGRLHILGIMNESIKAPKALSDYAPRILTINVRPDKVRDVIGKGGSTIRAITEETGASIDLTDDGTVKIYATTKEGVMSAKARVEAAVAEAEIGAIYDGTVSRVEEYGAFINILPNKDGLLHISQIQEAPVDKVSNYFKVGDKTKVQVLDIDRMGRIKLSTKAIRAAEATQSVETQTSVQEESVQTPSTDTTEKNEGDATSA